VWIGLEEERSRSKSVSKEEHDCGDWAEGDGDDRKSRKSPPAVAMVSSVVRNDVISGLSSRMLI